MFEIPSADITANSIVLDIVVCDLSPTKTFEDKLGIYGLNFGISGLYRAFCGTCPG